MIFLIGVCMFLAIVLFTMTIITLADKHILSLYTRCDIIRRGDGVYLIKYKILFFGFYLRGSHLNKIGIAALYMI